MTVGCDHGPNSQVRRDFTFHELTLCSMLKHPSCEISISRIRCHASPLDWTTQMNIGISGPRHFGTREIYALLTLVFSEMTFSVVRIWCHVSCWIRRLLMISGFWDSDLLQGTSTMFQTSDSQDYNLSLISELQNEISSSKLNLLARLIQVHIRSL
jgi:hypothetical protein